MPLNYERILAQVGGYLKPDGTLILEIGYQQGPDVTSLMNQTGLFTKVEIHKDTAQHDRIVTGNQA